MIYLAGQIPLDPATMTLISSYEGEQGIRGQTKLVLQHVERVLEAVGGTKERVVALWCFLAHLDRDQQVVEEMLISWCSQAETKTTLHFFGVSSLPRGADIEIHVCTFFFLDPPLPIKALFGLSGCSREDLLIFSSRVFAGH
jgi:2-iminobutanoate/2-iminopropanoate deaminase